MTDVIFTNSVARGRNGWFQMARATFFVDRARVHVNIVSKRAVCPGPVYLELSLEDAAALGRELIRQAGQEQQGPHPLTAVSRSATKRATRSKAESFKSACETT